MSTQERRECVLCGDLQQPSSYMHESATPLEEMGVSLIETTWKEEASPAEFRQITMEMETRGPNEYDATELTAAVGNAEILVVHKAPVPRTLLEAASDLEIVGCARGGTGNVDLDAAAEEDVTVLHAPGRNENAVADYTLALVLASVRRVVDFAESTASGNWELEFDPSKLPRDLENLTAGIVGFGNVGQNVAQRLAGFGTDLAAFDPFVDDETIRNAGCEPMSLTELLSTADVVTLHARLSEDTRGLIGESELAEMKSSAHLVNTARGGLIDEAALIDALQEGSIGAAALDVFEAEPLPADHPFLELDNVILSPHTAGSTRDAVRNGSRIVADDIARLLNDEEPQHRAV